MNHPERHGRPPFTPSPAEIRAAAEQIRESWTEHQCQQRAGVEPAPWEAPVIPDLPGDGGKGS